MRQSTFKDISSSKILINDEDFKKNALIRMKLDRMKVLLQINSSDITKGNLLNNYNFQRYSGEKVVLLIEGNAFICKGCDDSSKAGS